MNRECNDIFTKKFVSAINYKLGKNPSANTNHTSHIFARPYCPYNWFQSININLKLPSLYHLVGLFCCCISLKYKVTTIVAKKVFSKKLTKCKSIDLHKRLPKEKGGALFIIF